jgi:DNA gyrase subunit A
VVSSVLCHEGDDALYISEGGMLVRTPVCDVSVMGRNTQGVKLVNLKAEDRLVGLEVVSESDLEQYAARSGADALQAPEEESEGEPADVDAEGEEVADTSDEE